MPISGLLGDHGTAMIAAVTIRG